MSSPTITEKLKAFFDPYMEVPIEAWIPFAKLLTSKSFKKNEVLKASYQSEKNLHLIIKGSAGLFVFKDGHDICIDLCYEGEFTGDYYSLLQQGINSQTPAKNEEMSAVLHLESPIYVMALEPLETLSIGKNDLFNLYNQSEFGNRMARMVSELLYLQKQYQQIELLTQTAEQRYLNLLEKHPLIIQRTAAKHIASYLGITPESFSRMQKKLIK
jgi:CRP-like cAMP-binding protein